MSLLCSCSYPTFHEKRSPLLKFDISTKSKDGAKDYVMLCCKAENCLINLILMFYCWNSSSDFLHKWAGIVHSRSVPSQHLFVVRRQKPCFLLSLILSSHIYFKTVYIFDCQPLSLKGLKINNFNWVKTMLFYQSRTSLIIQFADAWVCKKQKIPTILTELALYPKRTQTLPSHRVT